MKPGAAPVGLRLRRVAALINPLAGGAGQNSPAEMAALLAERGVEAREHVLGPNLGLEAAMDLIDPTVDAVLVLGGDGTARAVAERLGPRGPPFAPLPGGTMNLLPKAIYGDRPWREIVADLAAGARSQPLAGARADHRFFLLAAVFGAPALVARAREAARRGRVREAIRRLYVAARRTVSGHVRAVPSGLKAHRGDAVALLAPTMSGHEGLEWVALAPRDSLDAMRIGFAALLGAGWRSDPATARAFAASGLIAAAGSIPAMLDGEPVTFHREVRVRLDPHIANVLLTAEEPA